MIRPADSKNVLVIHGPNLNLLGRREPSLYGVETLERINARLAALGRELGFSVESFQSNHEGLLVDKIQAAVEVTTGLIINPAAYTHTSVAIRDALLLLNIPIIEVHLSNVHRREAFRQESLIADIVTGRIVGLGAQGYELALHALARMI